MNRKDGSAHVQVPGRVRIRQILLRAWRGGTAPKPEDSFVKTSDLGHPEQSMVIRLHVRCYLRICAFLGIESPKKSYLCPCSAGSDSVRILFDESRFSEVRRRLRLFGGSEGKFSEHFPNKGGVGIQL